jgi:membrane-bound metal-dependent hydrolase YbcI (DUF457 family)
MIVEHLFYSMAIAIIVGMLYYRLTGRDHSWIIIICAWAPDLDDLEGLANPVLHHLGISFQHGTFHNIAFMVIFGIAVAFLLLPFGIKFFDSLFFSLIGFGAHLFEDALVYKVGYKFFWPFSSEIFGLGLLPSMVNEKNYMTDFFRVANTEVLIIGMAFLLVAIIIRTYVEGPAWIRWYMPDSLYKKLLDKTKKERECKLS